MDIEEFVSKLRETADDRKNYAPCGGCAGELAEAADVIEKLAAALEYTAKQAEDSEGAWNVLNMVIDL